MDPSGFPDGPNAHCYAPTPTSQVDLNGLYTIALNSNSISQGNTVAVNAGGVQIGSIYVTEYDGGVGDHNGGVGLELTPNITANTGYYYVWQQHVTAVTSKGTTINIGGQPANNMLDQSPQAAAGGLSWFYSSTEWNSNAIINGDGKSCAFTDFPLLNFNALSDGSTSETMTLTLKFMGYCMFSREVLK